MDPEQHFRIAPFDSAKEQASGLERYGQFNPCTLVLLLRSDLASALDTKGGTLPGYSVESGPTASLRSYSTQLHETIHYWQSVGSTAGFVNALGDATALYSVADDLRTVRPRSKPVAESDVRISTIWNHTEYGRAMLSDPVRAVRMLEKDRGQFVSVGQSLLTLASNTAITLAEAFDPSFDGLIDPRGWHGSYEDFVGRGDPGFETQDLLEIPIGLRDIAEGQARLCELQYRDLTQEPMDWAEVRRAGWLSGVYGKAFDWYLTETGRPDPESPRDDTVNLFLVLCDIAMNPACGIAGPVESSRKFVLDFHPGARFLRLCRRAAKEAGFMDAVEIPSFDGYEALCRRLCEPYGWQTPTETARTLLDRWDKARSGDELAGQQFSRSYGADDVHRRFLIGEHRHFLDSKVQIPHFFCWPAWAHLVFDDDPGYASTINEVLAWHRPPFTAETGRGVTTIEIPRMAVEEQAAFAGRYFGMQGLYDLARQWIAKRRKFSWHRFDWKASLSPADIEWFEEQFAATFGLRIEEIEVR